MDRRKDLRAVAVLALAAVGALLVVAPGRGAAAGAANKKSAAELEKEKALQNPYSNDLGPGDIDGVVKGYPAQMQAGYKLLKQRCAQCHLPSRPLNSRFVEPYVNDEKVKDKDERMKLKKAKIDEWRKSNPELFADASAWQIEPDMWGRYVKRMKSKPGCKMSDPEAKSVWEFLVYDSTQRKVGKNADAWKAHRKKLVDEFKEKYPARYKQLADEKDL